VRHSSVRAGRKLWLFSDVVYGALEANSSSLVDTGKANGVEPHG
jgi:hypothetical protein